MLIQKKEILAVNDTVSFRIANGEEVIAKLVDQDDLTITVSKPIVASIQMVAPQQAGISFGPFMATVDEDGSRFVFTKASLLGAPLKTRSDIAANYIKMTTGLDIPTGGLLKA